MFSLLIIAHAAVEIPVLKSIERSILNPIIELLFVGALAWFLYGVFQFVRGADNEEARRIGRDHIIWGVIGMFIMVSALGILNVICRTISC